MFLRSFLALAAFAATPLPAAAACADLALVLAVDASGSIGSAEYSLQRQGYARAFEDPGVRSALRSAGVVDVALVLWGDSEMAPQVFDWHRIAGAADLTGLTAELLYAPRMVTGNTGIGRGVMTALDLLEGHCAMRKVINVSGDGIETLAPRPRTTIPLVTARQRAAETGVTINALAIETDHENLAAWYTDHLITGAGSFVMTADDFDDFGAAIIRKLGREIAPPQLSAVAATTWTF